MRIAITGATGFLGRHVVARLAPQHELICITRSGSAPEGHTGLAIDLADPTDPSPALALALSGCDALIHAAGRVSHDARDAKALWDLHVVGTERVLAAAKAAGVPRVVYVGTSGTVSVSGRPVEGDEAGVEADGGRALFQRIARWPYYRSKWIAEELALLANCPEMSVICLNPGLLLGPGDDPEGEATKVVRLFLDQGMPVVPQGGPCFVDVRDVAAAIEAALSRGLPGRRHLLGGGNWSWEQLFGTLARITDKPAPRLQAPARWTKLVARNLPGLLDGVDGQGGMAFSSEDLELASHHWFCDWTRATQVLGFHPRDPVVTVQDTVADLLDRRRRGWMLYGRPA